MNEDAADLFRALDRELWVITARSGESASGLICTSVTQASINDAKPRVILGLAIHHLTQKLVERSGVFCAHLLSSGQRDWVNHFGMQTGRDLEKFQDLEMISELTEAPILTAADAWLECRVEESLSSGDRLWYLAEVVNAKWTPGFQPLTFHQFLMSADETTKALLKKQLVEDSLIDGALVEKWRQSRRSTDPGTSGLSSK